MDRASYTHWRKAFQVKSPQTYSGTDVAGPADSLPAGRSVFSIAVRPLSTDVTIRWPIMPLLHADTPLTATNPQVISLRPLTGHRGKDTSLLLSHAPMLKTMPDDQPRPVLDRSRNYHLHYVYLTRHRTLPSPRPSSRHLHLPPTHASRLQTSACLSRESSGH